MALTMALLGLLPALLLSAPTMAQAATKNANFDGQWTASDPTDPSEHLVLAIANENLTTGSFSGTFPFRFTNVSGVTTVTYLPLSGRVTGNTFTFTAELVPDTVVGTYGAQWVANGTIDGDTATATGVTTAWEDGRTVTGNGSGTLTREAEVAVSGTVDAATCGDTSCSEAPLAGQDILVTGTASDGSAVSETSTSGDDGSWSVQVPSGSYTAGPTLDGTTIDGRGFDPEQSPPLTIDTTPQTDVNFLTCAGPQDSSDGDAADDATSSGGDLTALASFDAADRVGDATLLSASAGSEICKANYTVTLKAALPEAVVVDPSLSAPYNTAQIPTEDGYNGKTSTWAQFQSKLHLDSVPDLGAELTYPDCLSKSQVATLTKDQVHLKWYTYLKGPSNLGGVKVPLLWNRSSATVTTLSQPVVTSGSLRRVYVIQEAPGFFGKDADPATYQCSTPTTRKVTPLVLTNVSGSKFTVIVYWVIPFNASALQVAQSTASKVADTLADKVSPKFKEAHETYEKLPEWYQVLLNTLAGGEILKGASALTKYETIEEVGELLSHTKGLSEFADEFAGYMSGQYNGFATAINGQFTTTRLSPDSIKPNVTNLKIAVTTDEFPDYSLSITRNGQALPWTQADADPGVIKVTNDYGANPAGMLTNTEPDASKYDSSKAAVNNVLAATSQMSFFSKSVAKYGSLNGYFSNGGSSQLNQLPDPKSNPDPVPTSDMLTWAFYDQKP
jgi:hypothetical protein